MSSSDRLKYPELDYLMNESGSDVTFVVDGKEVPAIRGVLSLKSKVFEAMFSGKYKESEQKVIPLEDVSYEAFVTLLRFVYTEQLVIDDQDLIRAMDVLRVADRYQIYRLVDAVRDWIRARINLGNFGDVCKMSFESGADPLIPDIKDFIENNFQILIQKDFKDLKRINDWTDSSFFEILTTRYRKADRHFGPFPQSEFNSQSQGVWKQCCNGQLPNDAVRGGTDLNGEPLYVGRAVHLDDCIPGKVVISHGVCYIPYDGKERPYRQYQVLTNPHKSYLVWQPSSDGEVPLTAIVGGQLSNGQKLYIGRTHYSGSLVIGKVDPNHRVLHFPFAGSEIPSRNYEILVMSDKPSEDDWEANNHPILDMRRGLVLSPTVPFSSNLFDEEAVDEVIEFD